MARGMRPRQERVERARAGGGGFEDGIGDMIICAIWNSRRYVRAVYSLIKDGLELTILQPRDPTPATHSAHAACVRGQYSVQARP